MDTYGVLITTDLSEVSFTVEAESITAAANVQHAATDLFAALLEVYHSNLIDGDYVLMEQVKRAIAKARGGKSQGER